MNARLQRFVMTFESSIELVTQLGNLMKSECQELSEDIDRQQRFHLHLVQRTDYGPFLQLSLQQGRQGTKLELLVCAEYLGYLVNFYPQWADELEMERGHYMAALASGIIYSKEVRRAYAMLIKDDSTSLLNEIKTRVEDLTSVTYLEEVAALMDVLSNKLIWQMKKRNATRIRPQHTMQRLIDQLINFLCIKQYGEKEEILMQVAKLMRLIFQYLRKDVSSYKTMIFPVLEHWLTHKVYRREVKEQLIMTLTASLQSLGLYKEELFYNFFTTNVSYLQEISYLELLATFLSKLDKNKRTNNQSNIEKILKNLLSSVLRVPNGPISNSYKAKSLLIDQIIKISSLFGCDMSKVLIHHLPHARNASHQALMGSLMPIFDQRMSAETIRCIQQQKRQDVQRHKQNKKYQAALEHYSNEEMDFEELVMNPELTGDFLWEFLMLRTTVSINYGAMCEIDKVVNFVINLIKFVLLGIFPLQCLEIIEKVVQNDLIYTLKQLEQVSYSEILISMKPILKKQVENGSESNNEKFSCLFLDLTSIIKLISSRYKVEELYGFKLFEAVITFSNELSRQYVTPSLIQHQNQLLEAVIPMDFGQINEEDFKRSMGQLITHLNRTSNIGDFLLYLEIMSRGVGHSHLQNVFIGLNSLIESFLNERQLPENLEDSYKINFYMLNKLPLSQPILENCWDMLVRMPSFHYPQFYFHIFSLFNYFAHFVATSNCQEEDGFLRFQMKMTEEVLVKLDTLIAETQMLQQVQQLLLIKQNLLLLLQETLRRYGLLRGSQCDELTSIRAYLFHVYQNMKNNRSLACSFEERPAIRQHWCNCQLLVLLMVASTMKSDSPTESNLIVALFDINEKFQWVSKHYPKNHQQKLQTISLFINVQLSELEQKIHTKFAQANNS